MIVRITEQHNDGDPGYYMKVDFLSAPDGVVEYPDSTGSFDPGDSVLVRWTTPYKDVIDAVDILLSTVGGHVGGYEVWDVVIDTDVAVGETDTTYTWVVADTTATSEGKIKVVFHNELSLHTHSAQSPGLFSISGDTTITEYVVAPVDGTEINEGETIDVVWTDIWQLVYDEVDVYLRPSSSGTWAQVIDDADYARVENLGSCEWTPTHSDVTGSGQLKLEFWYDDVFQYEIVSDGEFTVFPDSARFIDETGAVDLDAGGYSGTPYSAITLDYDDDGDLDLLVTLKSSDEEPSSLLFANTIAASGLPTFTNQTAEKFPGVTAPALGSTGAVAADFDNDEDEDLFVCHDNDPGLYWWGSDEEEFVKVTDDTSYVSLEHRRWLDHTRCAAWVDYDRDGDVDLHVGRVEWNQLIPREDAILENRGSGATPRFAWTNSGINNADSTATHTISWCDYDADGWWDVFVGGGGSGESSAILRQDTTGVFDVDTGTGFLSSHHGVHSSQWMDYDNDGDFDLLVSGLELTATIHHNDNGSLRDQASFSFTTAADCALGFDYDHDGRPEVLLVSSTEVSGGQRPELLANVDGYEGFDDEFIRASERVGFDSYLRGPFGGALAADFNNDGDLDLFLGRTDSPGRYFQTTMPDSSDTLTAHWLGVEAIAGLGTNSSAIGAVIHIARRDTTLGLQQIDGGSGRGGQQPRVPIFGLGYVDEPVDLTVRWPGGNETFLVVDALDQVVSADEPDSLLEVLTRTSRNQTGQTGFVMQV